MSNFIVTQSNKSLGPAFNEAASLLEKNKAVTALYSYLDMGVFIIEASEAGAVEVQKALPGWRLDKYDPKASFTAF